MPSLRKLSRRSPARSYSAACSRNAAVSIWDRSPPPASFISSRSDAAGSWPASSPARSADSSALRHHSHIAATIARSAIDPIGSQPAHCPVGQDDHHRPVDGVPADAGARARGPSSARSSSSSSSSTAAAVDHDERLRHADAHAVDRAVDAARTARAARRRRASRRPRRSAGGPAGTAGGRPGSRCPGTPAARPARSTCRKNAFSTSSKPRSSRSAVSAPRSAGCSQARELIPVSVTRRRAGRFSRRRSSSVPVPRCPGGSIVRFVRRARRQIPFVLPIVHAPPPRRPGGRRARRCRRRRSAGPRRPPALKVRPKRNFVPPVAGQRPGQAQLGGRGDEDRQAQLRADHPARRADPFHDSTTVGRRHHAGSPPNSPRCQS